MGGSALSVSLEGNPQEKAIWCLDESGEALTPAAWALAERRLAGCLSALADKDPEPTPLAEYLALSDEDRLDRTPVVAVPGAERPLRVDPALVDGAAERLAAWRTLQALARIGLPRAESVVEAEVLAAKELQHAAALDAVRSDYEARLAGQGAQLKAEIARQVRMKLLTIVAHQAGNGGTEA